MSNSIALSVDTQSLVHTLKHSFSRPESLVTELAQNARRAKASAIAFRNIDQSARQTPPFRAGKNSADGGAVLSFA